MPTPLPPLAAVAAQGLRFNDLMMEMSYALIEDVVNTYITDAVAAPGVVTVGVTSANALYSGAQIIVVDGANTERIIVRLVANGQITANFAFAHAAGVQIIGATFPSGEPDQPLFTQAEILGYLIDVQNDFLLKVRPLYKEDAPFPILQYARVIEQPEDAIRVERITINQYSLRWVSQTDLDLENPNWMNDTGVPRRFFEDQLGTGNMGMHPIPAPNYLAAVWFSYRAGTSYTIFDRLLVPRIFCHVIKYGALARVWNKDGEMRDQQRATYCQKRFDMGVMLAQRFMEGIGVPQPMGQPAAKFSPMVVD